MGLLALFRRTPPTANVAKERLRIIVAQERSARGGPDYLPLLRRELMQLKDAVQERDLPRALEIVLQLVPSYTPSATVRTLQRRALGALQS